MGGSRRLPISPLIDTYLVPEAPQGARASDTVRKPGRMVDGMYEPATLTRKNGGHVVVALSQIGRIQIGDKRTAAVSASKSREICRLRTWVAVCKCHPEACLPPSLSDSVRFSASSTIDGEFRTPRRLGCNQPFAYWRRRLMQRPHRWTTHVSLSTAPASAWARTLAGWLARSDARSTRWAEGWGLGSAR